MARFHTAGSRCCFHPKPRELAPWVYPGNKLPGLSSFVEGEPFMASAFEVGQKLVALCQQGKEMDAMETLYAPNIVSIEASGGPNMPQRMEGIQAVRGKAQWWTENHTVHSRKAEGPWP